MCDLFAFHPGKMSSKNIEVSEILNISLSILFAIEAHTVKEAGCLTECISLTQPFATRIYISTGKTTNLWRSRCIVLIMGMLLATPFD